MKQDDATIASSTQDIYKKILGQTCICLLLSVSILSQNMARIELLQKIANLLVYVYFVTTTGYYLLSKDRIADVFAGYQT